MNWVHVGMFFRNRKWNLILFQLISIHFVAKGFLSFELVEKPKTKYFWILSGRSPVFLKQPQNCLTESLRLGTLWQFIKISGHKISEPFYGRLYDGIFFDRTPKTNTKLVLLRFFKRNCKQTSEYRATHVCVSNVGHRPHWKDQSLLTSIV